MKASDYIRQGWCQYESALDSSGQVVRLDSPHAARFCMIAAMARQAIDEGRFTMDEEGKMLDWLVGIPSPVKDFVWNDIEGRTQADVIARLEQYGF